MKFYLVSQYLPMYIDLGTSYSSETIPLFLTKTKKKARKRIKELNIQFIRSNHIKFINYYNGNFELQEWIKKEKGYDPKEIDFKELTDIEILEMCNQFKITFFIYEKIKVEG